MIVTKSNSSDIHKNIQIRDSLFLKKKKKRKEKKEKKRKKIKEKIRKKCRKDGELKFNHKI